MPVAALHRLPPSEALQLTVQRVLVAESSVVFRSLKKRKVDGQGREKQPQFRTVPVGSDLIERMDLVFDLRARHKRGRDLDQSLWSMSRPSA